MPPIQALVAEQCASQKKITFAMRCLLSESSIGGENFRGGETYRKTPPQKRYGGSEFGGENQKQPEGPLTEGPSTQESHPDHGIVFHY